jgi:hypothetical protein
MAMRYEPVRALATRWWAKRKLPIVVAITAKPAILHPSVLDSLTIARHGKSSGELRSVMI